jgi:hypothetical protein
MMKFLRVLGFAVAAAFLLVIVEVAPSLAAGGAFSASYGGDYLDKSCGYRCGGVSFSGKGRAPFLLNFESGELFFHAPLDGTGWATLVSSITPNASITMKFAWYWGHGWTWRVSKGTGKFAHATGSGSWFASFNRTYHTYYDQWSGALYY